MTNTEKPIHETMAENDCLRILAGLPYEVRLRVAGRVLRTVRRTKEQPVDPRQLPLGLASEKL